ncbi:ubiquitin carboxyl-terminal hydrolase 44 [Biomphalaria glabrata]|nr:ubiquitin carboxyl-terminal hydrolase 44-like [Biomphalaria glabrata]
MEKCQHVDTFVLTKEISILDPSCWLCSVCGTTEWVWACLSCSNIACGRMNEQHAVQHFEATKHPLAIEINEKYVYCYVCDEYIFGDNEQGDIQALRSALTDIGTMSGQEVEEKEKGLLGSFSKQQALSRRHADEDDMLVTAMCHYRKSLLAKVFSSWYSYLQAEKIDKQASSSSNLADQPSMLTRSRASLFHMKRRTLIPGVTGLRNLGNTCYINSIVQSLGHLDDFREYFCQLVFGLFSPIGTPLPGASPVTHKHFQRLNTIDFFQHLNYETSSVMTVSTPESMKHTGGLNGGGSESVDVLNGSEFDIKVKTETMNALSLCQELHGLLRVLWSGKWAQVSPHGFLHAIWKYIPAFKGHLQHDAQEFLCELLDKVSQEIEQLPQCTSTQNIVDQSFRGEIISQVTCMSCNNISARHEAFLDLSLEFPRSFQYTSGQIKRNMCHLTEMLSTFTDVEDLEPKSYNCEHCNSSSQQKDIRTDAKKQLLISKPPVILRLHLKRFRWCGRNNREKINTHVAFDEELDISPFCLTVPTFGKYKLNAVVVHHGVGFRAGHYTAYTYNTCAGTWLHCNDARVQLVSMEDVLTSQAYILFYTREHATIHLDDMPALVEKYTEPDKSSLSTLPDLDQDTMHTLRQLAPGHTQHVIDEEVTISFHRDPVLVKHLSSRSNSSCKRTLLPEIAAEEPPEKKMDDTILFKANIQAKADK